MYALPRIRKIRIEKGLKQKDVYTKLGMKQQQYSRYESGEDEMRIGTFVEICEALEVSADYLLGFTDDPTPKKAKSTYIKNQYNNSKITEINNNNGNVKF